MNQWDERYSANPDAYGLAPNDFLKEHFKNFSHGDTVLSLGEGEGRNSLFLAQNKMNMIAIDYSKVGLEHLNQSAERFGLNIKTICADITNYDFTSLNFDHLISIWCHLPSSERKKVHKQLAQKLKKGGIVLIEAYNPDQLNYNTGGPKDKDLLLTIDDIKADFNNFEIIVLENKVRDVFEGKFHHGKSSVVQALLRKI